jgi:hypothetical protein
MGFTVPAGAVIPGFVNTYKSIQIAKSLFLDNASAHIANYLLYFLRLQLHSFEGFQ